MACYMSCYPTRTCAQGHLSTQTCTCIGTGTIRNVVPLEISENYIIARGDLCSFVQIALTVPVEFHLLYFQYNTAILLLSNQLGV